MYGVPVPFININFGNLKMNPKLQHEHVNIDRVVKFLSEVLVLRY